MTLGFVYKLRFLHLREEVVSVRSNREMFPSRTLLFIVALSATIGAIVIPSPNTVKLFVHDDTLYQLVVTKSERENIVKIAPVFKIPKCVEQSVVKPVEEYNDESQIRDEYLENGNIHQKRKAVITPPDPVTQIRMSRHGRYFGYPKFYGLSGMYSFYNYNAGNDVHNNLPRGQYKFESDIDSK